jgi:hypothetical protein
MLGPLLNSKSDLSVRNRVLLFKQLIHSMLDYACPACRSAARHPCSKAAVVTIHVSAPYYWCRLVRNRRIH